MYPWGKVRGLGHGLSNFVFDLYLFSKTCQKTMKKQRQPMSTFFDIDIADYKPQFPLVHPNVSHPYGNVSK